MINSILASSCWVFALTRELQSTNQDFQAIPANTSSQTTALNIGGGEIAVMLVLLSILVVAAVAFVGVIYLIVRAVQNRPSQVSSTVPPEVAAQNQQRRDREHLKLLSIFHFVFGGLALMGMAFLFVHYMIFHTVFSNAEMWKSQKGPMPPKELFDVLIWFYLFMGALLLACLVLNVLSGLFLWQKKHRVFSLIIGGLNCFQIPFGTALGAFTIAVLSRDSVRELYSGQAGV